MIAPELIQLPAFTDEVVRGLRSRPKTLPSKLFYDDRGSELFEAITRLPEYYLTRTEFEILENSSAEIARAMGIPVSVIELGAGTATKTGILLRAFVGRQVRTRYFPVDISSSALAGAKQRIQQECPLARIRPVVADFTNGFPFLREISGRKLVLYLGSSIGNFDWNDAIRMLANVRDQLSSGDALLLGTDMVKDESILVPAYNDAAGVTAEFNKNILRRLNRELEGNFDLDGFRHIAEWSPAQSRMEIYLESVREQSALLRAAGLRVAFSAGERIHTENSYKYTIEAVERMLCVSGFKLARTWFDQCGWFGLHLAEVCSSRLDGSSASDDGRNETPPSGPAQANGSVRQRKPRTRK
ncbi:MAG: L-histidine N(alpha)-methyltransferase [Acidobacteria bacterium]|nr:L-histidine N(alpha)-methyltransferase [Acidobacteriota bacterium]